MRIITFTIISSALYFAHTNYDIFNKKKINKISSIYFTQNNYDIIIKELNNIKNILTKK